MDERRQNIIAAGMGITLMLLYMSLFIVCIWKYVSTGDITNSTWELLLIVMIPASILWFSRKDESLMIPTMSGTTGKELPIEQNRETKQIRRKTYFWDSVGLATIFLILSIIDSLFIQNTQINDSVNFVLLLLVEFILSVFIFMIISFIWGEWQIRKYHQRLDDLEDFNE